jgi:ABC-type antimicrobial peptide transport system permease subunit
VSRNFAARYFPGTSAIGHKVHFTGAESGTEPWATIVGIAGDVQYQWTDDAPERAIYLNAAQIPSSDTKYAVVTSGDPLTIAPSVRRVVAGLDPTLPIDAVESYAEYLRESMIGLSHATTMLAMDALVALLLAAIGIFGVMANVVGERRREIGVRLTMGATRETVVRLLLGRAVMLLGIGLAVGVPMAAMLARTVAGLLYGVRPGDIGVFAATIVTIAGVTLFAAYLPARRASQLDPLELLRTE